MKNQPYEQTIHKKLAIKSRGMGGMLIFQCHLPHVIPNSMQALRSLSHLEITFRKAPFPYQHVS